MTRITAVPEYGLLSQKQGRYTTSIFRVSFIKYEIIVYILHLIVILTFAAFNWNS